MVIELFEKKPDDYKNRIVKLDHRSIDFKDKVVYLTRDPANADERYEFAEELSQQRDFRTDPSRFAVNIATESLKHGNKGVQNKLGNDWYNKNNNKNPTINEIREGIKKQERVQLLLTSGLNS